MKRLLVLVALMAVCLPACKTVSPPAVTETSCKNSVAPAANTKELDQDKKSALRIGNIAPSIGMPLREDSVLAADLDYYVKDFEEGRYFIVAQFAFKDDPLRSTDGDFPTSHYPILPSSAGSAHICFPLRYVWNKPVKRPFDVRFFINRRSESDPLSSRSVASTEHLQYPTQ